MASTGESVRVDEAPPGPVHGGRLVARTLKERGVSHLFTLSGGHLFSIYDGCKHEGLDFPQSMLRRMRGEIRRATASRRGTALRAWSLTEAKAPSANLGR